MIQSMGLVVNPIAGIGGPAGLKGSDGAEIQEVARQRGSLARAQARAVSALTQVADVHPGVTVITAAGTMGADAVTASGLISHIVYEHGATTSAEDTKNAAQSIVRAGAGLLVFVGGDGTARDVADAVGEMQPVLGVPAGVKMYSSCFAVSPMAAGSMMAAWVGGERLLVREREVLDVDEEQLREGRFETRLFGIVSVPFSGSRTQAKKSGTVASEWAAVESAARGVVADMGPETFYLLGPGSTIAAVARQLGVANTALGVDIVKAGELVLADASEEQILAVTAGFPTRAVVTVIGGQGFVLGRGNQQLSSRVLTAIGADPLIVVATEEKLIALAGRPLLVDTGDELLDQSFGGYLRVVTGVNNANVYPVHAA